MQERISVVFVIDSLMPRGGMESALIALAQDLSSDLPVAIYALSGPELPAGVLPESVECVYLGVRPGPARLLRCYLPIRRVLPRPSSHKRIVAVGIWGTVALHWARRTDMRTTVVWEHSLTAHLLQVSLKMRILWRLAGRAYGRAESVVCVSDATKAVVQRRRKRGSRTLVVANLLAPEPEGVGQAPTTKDEAPLRLLGVGALTHDKNWALAIEALRFLPDDTRLAIAGEGPEHAPLARLINELNLAKRVELLGYRTDIQGLLVGADVLVHPSQSETFGYSLFEAAQAHVPVAVCDFPVMNEVVSRYVPGVVSPADAASFAAATRSAARIAAQVEIWEACGLRRQRDFSHDRVMSLWKEVLAPIPGVHRETEAGPRGRASSSRRR